MKRNRNVKTFYLLNRNISKFESKLHWVSFLVLDANFGIRSSVASVEGQRGSRSSFSGTADLFAHQEGVRTLASGLPVRAANRMGKTDLKDWFIFRDPQAE